MFLEKIKALSPYFVKFVEDGSIFPKEYPENCKMGWSNQGPIIIITYDESTFSTNVSAKRCKY